MGHNPENPLHIETDAQGRRVLRVRIPQVIMNPDGRSPNYHWDLDFGPETPPTPTRIFLGPITIARSTSAVALSWNHVPDSVDSLNLELEFGYPDPFNPAPAEPQCQMSGGIMFEQRGNRVQDAVVSGGNVSPRAPLVSSAGTSGTNRGNNAAVQNTATQSDPPLQQRPQQQTPQKDLSYFRRQWQLDEKREQHARDRDQQFLREEHIRQQQQRQRQQSAQHQIHLQQQQQAQQNQGRTRQVFPPIPFAHPLVRAPNTLPPRDQVPPYKAYAPASNPRPPQAGPSNTVSESIEDKKISTDTSALDPPSKANNSEKPLDAPDDAAPEASEAPEPTAADDTNVLEGSSHEDGAPEMTFDEEVRLTYYTDPGPDDKEVKKGQQNETKEDQKMEVETEQKGEKEEGKADGGEGKKDEQPEEKTAEGKEEHDAKTTNLQKTESEEKQVEEKEENKDMKMEVETINNEDTEKHEENEEDTQEKMDVETAKDEVDENLEQKEEDMVEEDAGDNEEVETAENEAEVGQPPKKKRKTKRKN